MVSDKAIIEFLRRSYSAVDGLWFVRIEDEHSYEEALRLDEQVWGILPKIQARKARSLLDIEGGSLADLLTGLRLKFISEEYAHHVIEQSEDLLRVGIDECPWLKLLEKSGRMSRAAEICDRVCARDFSVWAAEFSREIEFSLEHKLPDGAPMCELLFKCACSSKDTSVAEKSMEAAE